MKIDYIVHCKNREETNAVQKFNKSRLDWSHWPYVVSTGKANDEHLFASYENAQKSYPTHTLIKFEDWVKLDEFVLPEKWAVRTSNRGESEAVAKWICNETKHYPGYYNTSVFHYPLMAPHSCTDCFVHSGYTEITFEQFKEHVLRQPVMKKKIIGYKIIKEYPGSSKVGTIMRLGEKIWGGNLEKAPNFPEFFEPVYEEESVTLFFGDVEFTIKKGNDFAETKYGKVTSAEVERFVDMIESPPSLAGHKLDFQDKLKIGCKSGTVNELMAIANAMGLT